MLYYLKAVRILPISSSKAPENSFDLLYSACSMKKIHSLEKFTQAVEAEKRKICLAKMRKEEETRGKAKRGKEKVFQHNNNKP